MNAEKLIVFKRLFEKINRLNLTDKEFIDFTEKLKTSKGVFIRCDETPLHFNVCATRKLYEIIKSNTSITPDKNNKYRVFIGNNFRDIYSIQAKNINAAKKEILKKFTASGAGRFYLIKKRKKSLTFIIKKNNINIIKTFWSVRNERTKIILILP